MTELLERLRAALADRYAVESEIGRGGMAVVFLAEDLRHGRRVAIKVLHPELAATLGAKRFLREIQIAAKLEHPHILTLIDSGEADGLPYFVMPFVDGESLSERLTRAGQLPLEEALRIAAEVADGLDYAHEQGVVHRDIKPGNILLSRGHALIADFGIAKAIDAASGADASATATGLTVGTPRYMSPEQAAGATATDGRSDVYALGCVLWEMLAGQPPFDGPIPHVILARKATEEPPEVRIIRKTVPPVLENVLVKAMATSAADRFQTAGELAEALKSPETVGRVRRRGRRRWQLAIGAASFAAVGAGVWALADREFTGSESDNITAIPLDSTKIAVLPFQVIGADSASPSRIVARSFGRMFEVMVTGESAPPFAHHGSVTEEWQRAGGTLDTELPEAAQLELGRSVGAGKLVRGTIVEAEDEVMLAASMIDVGTGAVRVATERAEGRLEELFALADQLIVLVLSGDRGISTETKQRLKQYKPDAVQALLASEWDQALAADSTLIDAALWKFANGETDTVALSYAWENQDDLSERGRAYLQVLGYGRYGDIRTRAEVITGYEDLTRRWPEWEQPWNELGQKLAVHGAEASERDWRRRAREAFEHIDFPSAWHLWNLSELAFMDQDAARARDLVDSLQVLNARESDSFVFAPRIPAYAWRLAILEGDTAAATRALADTPDSLWIPGFALLDGRGIADADRVVAAGVADTWFPDNWAWARGREPEWRETSDRRPENRFIVPVVRALLLGSLEDSIAVEAVHELESIVSESQGESLSPQDRTRARCWLTLWRLGHGDTTGARATLRQIAELDRPRSFGGWVGLFEVLLARLEGGEVSSSLLRADSMVRELGGSGYEAEIQNLMLARLLLEYGEPERALAAIRRRRYHAPYAMDFSVGAVPEYLREEAKLAATVGDTTGAIEAYRHYFALRDVRPDHPTWAAQWDSMRIEYGELTGVEIQ